MATITSTQGYIRPSIDTLYANVGTLVITNGLTTTGTTSMTGTTSFTGATSVTGATLLTGDLTTTGGSVSITTKSGVAAGEAAGTVRTILGTGNAAGLNGYIISRFPSLQTQVITGGVTLTAKQTLGGYLSCTGVAAALATLTGTQISSAVVGVGVGDYFDLVIDAVVATTVTAGVGVTVRGTGVIPAGSIGIARFINTAANTWIVTVNASV